MPAQHFDPSPPDDEETPLPIRRIVAGVYRRFWRVWLFGALGGFLGLTASVLRNDRFETQAMLLLTAGSEFLPLAADPALENLPNAVAGNLPFVLTSYELCARVVDDVGPEAILAPFRRTVEASEDAGLIERLRAKFANLRRSLSRPSFESLEGADARNEAIERLQENLEISIPAYASVAFVSYSAPDPFAARDTLTAYLRHAKAYHLGVYSNASVIELAELRSREADDRLAKTNADYTAFLESLGVSDFERALTQTREAVGSMQEGANELRRTVSDQEIELRLLKERLEKTEPQILAREEDPIAKFLETKLQEAILELADLQVVHQGPDPMVLDAKDRIDILRAQLTAQRETAPERPEPNPKYEELQKQILDLETELEQNRKNANDLVKPLTAAEAKLAKLEQREVRHSELLAAVRDASEEVGQMDQRMERVRLKQDAIQNDLSSLEPLQPPLPGERQSIRSIFLVGGAAVVGAGLGLALALLLALLDRRVRFSSDLEAIACGPVLGVVPRSGRRNIARHLKERRFQ